MNKDIQCPYCEGWHEHDGERNESCVSYPMECRHCERNFLFQIEYYPTFTERKADCLNGASHEWKDRLKNNEYYRSYFKKWRVCEWCEKEEREALVAEPEVKE